MRSNKIIILFFLLTGHSLMAQENLAQPEENLLFEKTKGILPYPLEKVTKVWRQVEAMPIITFSTDSAYAVRAVFDGVVTLISQIDSAYVTIVMYGNYFVTYYGTEKPAFKKGNSIKKGQVIGRLVEDLDSPKEYNLEVLITNLWKDQDPAEWFVKENFPLSTYQ